jgi:hypothetical protein
MAINSTNTCINKTNNHLSPQIAEHKTNQDIRLWQFRSVFWQVQKCGGVKSDNEIQTLPS